MNEIIYTVKLTFHLIRLRSHWSRRTYPKKSDLLLTCELGIGCICALAIIINTWKKTSY